MTSPTDATPSRFILRRMAGAKSRANDLPALLGGMTGVTVLDVSPRMMLVDASRTDREHVIDQCGGWELIPEAVSPLPDPRVQIGRG